MTKLSTERQVDYDDKGLPMPLIVGMRVAPKVNTERPRDATDAEMDFTRIASNAFHSMEQRIENVLNICTTDNESKQEFINRVRGILSE